MSQIAMIIAMFKRQWIELKRYYFNTISSLVSMYLIFLLIFMLATSLAGGSVVFGKTIEGLVVGFMIFYLAAASYSEMAWDLANEAKQGTLEQLSMSPFGLVRVLLARLETGMLYQLFIISVLLLMMMLTTGRWLNLDVISILPLLLVTVIGIQGIGFIMGGLALVFKQVQSSFQILQFFFIALTTVPVDAFPFMKYLPLAWGTHLIKQVMINNRSITSFSSGDILFLVGNSACYFLVGIVAFKWFEHNARARGLLGHY